MSKLYYTEKFYDKQRAKSLESARIIVPVILDKLRMDGGVRSVLDIGCGMGAWLSVFRDSGVNKITGIDGDYVNREDLFIDADNFYAYDLQNEINLGEKYDLTISLEVAEHLPEETAKNFVKTCCNHSDVVVFSAAHKGQGSKSHVNEQHISYWAKLFRENKYNFVDCIRPELWDKRDIANNGFYQYVSNIMLYIKETNTNDLLYSTMERTSPLGAIHPALTESIHINSMTKLLKVQKEIIIKAVPLLFKGIKNKLR